MLVRTQFSNKYSKTVVTVFIYSHSYVNSHINVLWPHGQHALLWIHVSGTYSTWKLVEHELLQIKFQATFTKDLSLHVKVHIGSFVK